MSKHFASAVPVLDPPGFCCPTVKSLPQRQKMAPAANNYSVIGRGRAISMGYRLLGDGSLVAVLWIREGP
jgi:hypothetical protein